MYDAWKTTTDRDAHPELEPLARCVTCEDLFEASSLDEDGLCRACGADREVAEPDEPFDASGFGEDDDPIDELPF